MRLASVFSDSVVLQRDISIPVWGWTEPRRHVRVTLGSAVAEGYAGPDGKFLLRLPPMPAGGPYELVASTPAGQSAKAVDVYVGEVWVASGQSNMEFTLMACGTPIEHDAPKIRMLTVPRIALPGKQVDVDAKWLVGTRKNLAGFSAVAFHFAKKLQESLGGVAVGILNSSWGGTRVETWTSREALIQNPDTRAEMERYETSENSPEFPANRVKGELTDAVAVSGEVKGYLADPGNEGLGRGWAKPDCDDSKWPTMALPCKWQSCKLEFSGVVWFRREIEVPKSWAGKELCLGIGAVDKHDVTYWNGEQIGATGSGFDESVWNIPRQYKIPGKLVRAGKNVVAVRAFSFAYDGGLIGPAAAMNIAPAEGSAKPISLAGQWRYQVEHNFGKVYMPLPSPFGPGNPNTPAYLYDNMIHPILPYGIRGAIWYQGESNVGNAYQYRNLMVGMIRDWRRAWGQGQFPFIMVQLANYTMVSEYQKDSGWARLREAQLQSITEPGVGIATAIDIGEANDIHPRNKRDVGQRLAQWALAHTYGQPVVPAGPLYSGMSIEGGRIRIRFDNVGKGLTIKGDKKLKCFVIAGTDQQFQIAKAELDENTVLVSSPEVAAPVAVRYAWADNPEEANLYNHEGLPAFPFRTDTWI